MLILRICRPACLDCGTVVQHTAISFGDRVDPPLMYCWLGWQTGLNIGATRQTAMLTLTWGGPLGMWDQHHLNFFASCNLWLSTEGEWLHTCRQWALHHSPKGSSCTCTTVFAVGKSPPAEGHHWPQINWPSWLFLYSSRLVLHPSVCCIAVGKSRLSFSYLWKKDLQAL